MPLNFGWCVSADGNVHRARTARVGLSELAHERGELLFEGKRGAVGCGAKAHKGIHRTCVTDGLSERTYG